MLGLAETIECRRVRLLAYFGEAAEHCGNCDNCLEPPEPWDATEAARKLLSCIFRVREASGFGFGAQHIIAVLRGQDNARVRQYGHEQLSTFGIGADLDEREWRAVLRQLIAQGLVAVDHERHQVLVLTSDSRALLRGERRLSMRRPVAPPRTRATLPQERRQGGEHAASATEIGDEGGAHAADPSSRAARGDRVFRSPRRGVVACRHLAPSTHQGVASNTDRIQIRGDPPVEIPPCPPLVAVPSRKCCKGRARSGQHRVRAR